MWHHIRITYMLYMCIINYIGTLERGFCFTCKEVLKWQNIMHHYLAAHKMLDTFNVHTIIIILEQLITYYKVRC